MDEILRKLAFPLAAALLSWLIKDLLIKSLAKRKELARTEWEYRLKQIWSPLFYWSGVITLSDTNQGWNKHGVKELESLLSKSAQLLPLKHYHALVRMIEGATNQKTSKIGLVEAQQTRDYIYRQIQLLNYLLYRHEAIYEPDFSVDIIAPYRFLLRAISAFFLHLSAWALIAVLIYLFYYCYVTTTLWPIFLFAGFFAIIVGIDVYKRIAIHKEIKNMLNE